jgi:hypothetical protein
VLVEEEWPSIVHLPEYPNMSRFEKRVHPEILLPLPSCPAKKKKKKTNQQEKKKK